MIDRQDIYICFTLKANSLWICYNNNDRQLIIIEIILKFDINEYVQVEEFIC
jgi:hypothetical protein